MSSRSRRCCKVELGCLHSKRIFMRRQPRALLALLPSTRSYGRHSRACAPLVSSIVARPEYYCLLFVRRVIPRHRRAISNTVKIFSEAARRFALGSGFRAQTRSNRHWYGFFHTRGAGCKRFQRSCAFLGTATFSYGASNTRIHVSAYSIRSCDLGYSCSLEV